MWKNHRGTNRGKTFAKGIRNVLVFYCKDCKMSICVRCFNREHDKHEIWGIEEFAGKFKNDLKRYSVEAGDLMKNIDELSRKVSKQTESYTQDCWIAGERDCKKRRRHQKNG